MHVQVLSSGSGGNALLVRAGEVHVLLDAGLPLDELHRRLEAARVRATRIDHICLTHGHLDHARSAGRLAKLSGATLHCCERLMRNASVRRAPRMSTLRIGTPSELEGPCGTAGVAITAVQVPHDADPTVAFRLTHVLRGEERVAVLVTDMGKSDPHAAKQLAGAHLIVLEFNHDLAMLRDGPYADALKRRVGGDRGHLSNEQAADMLRRMAGPRLHTVVLAHLSRTNNTPELALAAARAALDAAGRSDVRILVAEQDTIGPNLAV